MNKVVDCKAIADEILDYCKELVEHYDNLGYPRRQLLIVSNDDPASQVYVRNKTRACTDVGIGVCVAKNPKPEDFEKFHAVIVQLPTDKPYLLNYIKPRQDVDGFCDENIGALNNGYRPLHLPCTPKGIMSMLSHEEYVLDGKHVVIVGRSNIVGRPLSRMMELENATVTLCHSRTRNLKEICSMADVLVVAIG